MGFNILSYLLDLRAKGGIAEKSERTRNYHTSTVAGLKGGHEHVLLAKEFRGTSLAVNTSRERRA